jgi:predicted MFS family arabinose efflux permease
MGVGFYMFHNTLQTNATQMAPARRGAAVALFALAYFGGQTVGVALSGMVSAWLGTGVVILLSAVVVMLVSRGFAAAGRVRV